MPQVSRLTDKDIIIAKRVIEGVPQDTIGREVGISQTEVSRRANKPQVREIIDRAHRTIIENTLPQAVDNIHYAVSSYKKTKDEQLKEHGFKASTKVLESAGLFSGPSQSIVHQTYINQQTNVNSPVINELISKHLKGFALPKPIWEEEDAIEEGKIQEDCK